MFVRILTGLQIFLLTACVHRETSDSEQSQTSTHAVVKSTGEALATVPTEVSVTRDQFETLASRLRELEEKVQQAKTLSCFGGLEVQGGENRWSPWSTCPDGSVVSGLQRIDLLGEHNKPNLHVNDFMCNDSGCKAWCIGSGCTVQARCCRY